MHAVQVLKPGPPETLVIDELPDLQPGAGEVLIDIQAAAVNYPDLLVITGRYQSSPALPFTPGKEAAGIVRAIGPGVTRVQVGARVLAHLDHGGFATQCIAPEAHCFPLPEAMGFVDAVGLGLAAQTAWFALFERGHLQGGETVLITGASGAVGQAAAQIAHGHGCTVLAAASNLPRAQGLLEGTPCHFVDLGVPNLRDGLRQQVHATTHGKGADVVIDTLGGDVFDASLRALAWCGRIVTVGFAAGRIPEVKANYLLVKNIAASGLQWTDYLERQPQRVAQAHDDLTALWTRGVLRPQVMHTFALRDIAQALTLIDMRRAEGRLVLTMA
ncbi:NADPH:quinone oxidoreductase family protein [Variovorax rhizosphaerae]|uniref:NADPH:quinone oxidoreductase family protein n=1 Tax=Variovorax rhizosphaerae TaxID=1836200 RepID=A0ABU8WWM4_9BURK